MQFREALQNLKYLELSQVHLNGQSPSWWKFGDDEGRVPKSKVMMLHKILKKKLLDREMNISDLARATGINKTTLHNWSSGLPPKNIEQVRTVAKYLGLSIEELVFGEAAETPGQEKLGVQDIGEEWLSGVFELKIRRVKLK